MPTLLQRIEALSIPEPNSGCWLWLGCLDKDGYGWFSGGVSRRAHRTSYEVLVGPIPPGLVPDHVCRVRSCVNPRHLELVTRRTNTLRGVTRAATNASKTHCSAGHEYSEANTYVERSCNGKRHCRRCWSAASLRYKARKRVLS